jgi:hypothetical protein
MVSNLVPKLWSFCALVDSTRPKDSNDILFVIFGLMDRKIWFSKDLAKNIFEFLIIWTLFDLGADTCQIPISPYHFIWISNVEHQILKDLDVPDWTIPVHLSEPIWSTTSRSGGYDLKREERGYLGLELQSPVKNSDELRLWSRSSVTLW